jgi:hypothetical protein
LRRVVPTTRLGSHRSGHSGSAGRMTPDRREWMALDESVGITVEAEGGGELGVALLWRKVPDLA